MLHIIIAIWIQLNVFLSVHRNIIKFRLFRMYNIALLFHALDTTSDYNYDRRDPLCAATETPLPSLPRMKISLVSCEKQNSKLNRSEKVWEIIRKKIRISKIKMEKKSIKKKKVTSLCETLSISLIRFLYRMFHYTALSPLLKSVTRQFSLYSQRRRSVKVKVGGGGSTKKAEREPQSENI